MKSEKKFNKEDHEIDRELITWGTRGITSDQPVVLKKLKDLHTNHINAILITQAHITIPLRKYFENELEYRDKYINNQPE